MKLFFYKSNIFDPLLLIICKISLSEEYDKIVQLSDEIFHILIDNEYATDKNILVFSIIKDYEKSTINLILPSVSSNQILVDKCHLDSTFMNMIVVEILRKSDTEFYFEILENKIQMHMMSLNLMSLANFYKT